MSPSERPRQRGRRRRSTHSRLSTTARQRAPVLRVGSPSLEESMVHVSLLPGDLEFLREVVQNQRPSLLPLLDRLGRVPLTVAERTKLRLGIFGATGLTENYEPNAWRLRLETLIDYLEQA